MPESPDNKSNGGSCLEGKRMDAWVNGELSPAEEEDFLAEMRAELSQRGAALGLPPSEPEPERAVPPEWYEFRNRLEWEDFAAAAALLEKMPSLIDAKSGIGETVLHYLAVENRQDAVEWLHARGADLNTINDFGRPLLFEVAQLGYESLLLWLLARGADPMKTDAEGIGLAEHLIETGHPEVLEFLRKHINL